VRARPGVTELRLKVDPAQPAEFVTAAGSTDDSRNLVNSWKLMFLGLAVALIGAVLAYVRLDMYRMDRRKPRAAGRGQR
jgi:threonine/homoserine efflux transporter RhtA